MFGAQVPLQWPITPSVLIGLVLLTGGYLGAVTRWRGHFPGSRPVPRARVAAFLLAMGCIFLALHTPIDQLSDDYLFSVHMFQHLVLTLFMPPLFLYGLPGWLVCPPLVRWPLLLRVGRWLTGPIVAFGLFNVIFTFFHVPALYGATLDSLPLHVATHLIFMATGVITWWPVLSPLPELPAIAPPLRMIYLFLQTLPSQALGALLTFASRPLYEHYAVAPRAWTALDPALDQQLGGLIMWIGGGTFFLGAFVVVFLRWARLSEANDRPRAMGRV